MKILRYWWERLTTPLFGWGHPDYYSDAEAYFFNKHKDKS